VTCFDPFPFPNCAEDQKAHIRELGERLDGHRKRQQAQNPGITITDMYNVLEKFRGGESLTDSERVTHKQGLISVLRKLHDDLDAAVFAAYGWPVTLTDEELLQHLVTLNAERAQEEAKGLVRWLRPKFQRLENVSQQSLDMGDTTVAAISPARKQEKIPWPKTLAEQAKAVRQALTAQPGAMTVEEVAKRFVRGKPERVGELLETLVSLGQAREVDEGKFTA
jgi:hypothetical protein